MIYAKYYRNFALQSLPLSYKANLSSNHLGKGNDFLDKFNKEIMLLNGKERSLALKLSKSSQKPLAAEQKQQIIKEQNLIEYGRKYLAIIVQAMQQSINSIIANFR